MLSHREKTIAENTDNNFVTTILALFKLIQTGEKARSNDSDGTIAMHIAHYISTAESPALLMKLRLINKALFYNYSLKETTKRDARSECLFLTSQNIAARKYYSISSLAKINTPSLNDLTYLLREGASDTARKLCFTQVQDDLDAMGYTLRNYTAALENYIKGNLEKGTSKENLARQLFSHLDKLSSELMPTLEKHLAPPFFNDYKKIQEIFKQYKPELYSQNNVSTARWSQVSLMTLFYFPPSPSTDASKNEKNTTELADKPTTLYQAILNEQKTALHH